MTTHYNKFNRIKDIKELADKYRKECPMSVRSINKWLTNKIYESSAPRYYISFEEARRNVSKILKNKPINRSNKYIVEMYKDLAEKVKKYNIEHNRNIIDFECLFNIIDNQAKSFYLSKHTILNIISSSNYEKRYVIN